MQFLEVGALEITLSSNCGYRYESEHIPKENPQKERNPEIRLRKGERSILSWGHGGSIS